jgi:N-formylglutamate deformylase
VPTTDFDGEPLWLEAASRMQNEIEAAARLARALSRGTEAELERVRDLHGIAAILYDCHSIRSVIPYLFEGTLPDFNIGTNNGATCAREIETAVVGNLRAGGRLFQRPQRPLQGRLDHPPLRPAGTRTCTPSRWNWRSARILYSEDTPFAYDEVKAGRLRVHLKKFSITC